MSETNNGNRSMKEIISDATDKELEQYETGSITPDELKAMVVSAERKKKRNIRRITGIAALFVLVAVGAVMGVKTFTVDVDADKNGKEEIVTEDGVVIEDGGWGSSSEENWVITDWAEVKVAKATVPELLIPEYVPDGYDFETLTIEGIENTTRIDYLFSNQNSELIIQQCIQDEYLKAMQIDRGDRQISSTKGTIYVKDAPENKNATIHIDDGIIIYIWTIIPDTEIVKIIEHISY